MDASTALALAYGGTLGLLALYGAHRLWMVHRFRWGDRTAEPSMGTWPGVTVQLPVFNERTVVRRLIRAAGRLSHPGGDLELQVLDDSTDETSAIVEEEVAALVAAGVDAKVVRRTNRDGFKAGALDHGLSLARHDYLCVFDADFLPEPDFLERMLPYFADPGIGMAQARWGHENRDESALTRAQATLLDGHFVIEHKVRYDDHLFFNFNGTAGVWRRQTIEEAGGWQHDTLTEDLDLSYRAQLAGWRFHYASEVVAPAELPPGIAAFKSQQHRWAKGSMQVVRKLGPRILGSGEPWRVRREALAHLTAYVGAPCVLMMSLLLPLLVDHELAVPQWLHLLAFFLCTVSVLSFYEGSQRAIGRGLGERLRDTLMAVVLGTGMCVSQTRAVIEGLLPRTGTFVRTPKRGDDAEATPYVALLKGLPGIELALAAWFAWGIAAALRGGKWGVFPFLVLFFVSFLWVGGLSLRDAARARPRV